MNIKVTKNIQLKTVALADRGVVNFTLVTRRIERSRDIVTNRFPLRSRRQQELDYLVANDDDLGAYLRSVLHDISADTIVDDFIKVLLDTLGNKGGEENHRFLREFVYYEKALQPYREHAVFSLGLDPSLGDVGMLVSLTKKSNQSVKMRAEALYTLCKILKAYPDSEEAREIHSLAQEFIRGGNREFTPAAQKIITTFGELHIR